MEKQNWIERLIYTEQKNSNKETKSARGMLKAIGSSTPLQMLICICSKPNVRKMPATIDSNALKISPA
ncbi:hypothetical protein ACQKMI_17840 [Lysinibacillus sp. NPDC097214]|uniref:hypothetical protein n=1 Tax=Lysinibacillus sp. NPDC097214 TaxID=3390584 RepID=UPI003D0852C7